jgi:hypothetical protein
MGKNEFGTMTGEFPILKVTRAMRRDVEQLGSKPKFWFKLEEEDWLFKEARENTGEDWAEKIASEIASLLELPTHHVELAIYEGKRGCAVKSFLDPSKQVLVHGNELLGGFITGYDKEKHWGQSDHTFDNIVAVLENLFPEGKPRRAAASRMVGYLVLDALIGNIDRHHQNWGAVLEARVNEEGKRLLSLSLAPTFDHASSLGRELTDDARERRIREQTIEKYIRHGRGGIFANAEAKHGMSPFALAKTLAQRFPDFFKPWQVRVQNLPQYKFEELVGQIPAERISECGRAFILAFLESSRKLILSL